MEVQVRSPETGVLGDVLDALSRGLGLPDVQLWSGSAALPPGTPLTAGALRHGAVLGLGRPGPREAPGTASGALEVHITGGPDAGRTVPLGQDPLVLGRGAGCGLTIADPDVSRRHAVITLAEGRVTVTDLGSSNGTVLSTGAALATPIGQSAHEWPVGATILLGSSTLRLTGPRGAPLELVPTSAGRQLLRALGTSPRPLTEAAIRLPPAPVESAGRRLGWVAVALPAVGGLLMAWLLDTPQFLFFALLSPLVAIAGWASDRVTGRRTHRRAVADHAVARALAEAQCTAAVAADLARREEAHPDPASLAAAARRRCSPLWSRSGGPSGLTIRLGRGPGPTTVTRLEPDGSRSAATAEHVPVPLDLMTGRALGVVGPRPSVLGVARSVVCQLAVLTSPAHLRLVLVCGAERAPEWQWLRWLPQLHTVVLPGDGLPAPLLDPAAASPAGQASPSGQPPTTVVLLDGPADPSLADALARASGPVVRIDVADTEAALAMPVAALLQITGETGSAGLLRVPGQGGERLLTVDAVSRSTAVGIARDLAPLTVPAPLGRLPDTARLLDLPAAGLAPGADGELVGEWHRGRRALLAVLGCSVDGPLGVDLVADGPHALIAGTTGSGKSELLQTLVASLALHHPPDRCSFLLIDYKGGAAFGDAAALPHTVGVLTDLDHHSTARALRSLSAELTRRERLLAEHRARDLADLPDAVDAARLVIVVDEFATLVEELPGFVSGLVGIAQRGRSLGVHLVLATQRPAGVVSPEIRANSSLRICLRTTDDGDARDVLGSSLPAHLPPDRPGRAYVRTGATDPVLMQAAQVSGGAPRAAVAARRHPWPPRAAGHPPPTGPGSAGSAAMTAANGGTDLQRLVRALAEAARSAGISSARRPWLPPLPDDLPAATLDHHGGARPPTQLRIGLLDVPDAQSQTPLELDLAVGGGWLVVGGPRSGRTTFLRTVLTEAVRQLPAAAVHVHVLDHGGGAMARYAAGFPHCGTALGRDDPHRTVRLLARLGEEVDRRRAGDRDAGRPLLLVLVDGYDSLVAQLEDADPATGAAGLLRLAREGAAVGVTVVIGAERAVPGSRISGAVRTRLVLPLPDRADYAVAGVPARAVPGHRPPGRALVGEDVLECQLVLPRPCPELLPDALPTPLGEPTVPPPIRISALPADPSLPLPAAEQPPSRSGLWLPLGPGGDEGATLGVDLHRAGGLLVVGPPGSGRSSALRAFAEHCAAAGVAVAELVDAPDAPAVRRSDDALTGDRSPARHQLGRQDAEGLRAWLAAQGGGPMVVVADDVTSLPDPVADLLSAPVGSAANRPVVVGAGTAPDLAGAFRGPASALRRTRTALLLRPAAGDAELLGLRIPRSPLPPRPGAGWLVTPASATRLQVARHRTSAAPS